MPTRQLDNVVFFQAQLGQRRAGNDGGVVPAQIRNRLGQLLQPAHIRPAAVVDIRIGPEDDLERILRRGRGNRSLERRARTRLRGLVVGRAVDPALVQRLPPARLKVALDQRLPGLAHRIVGAQHRLIQQRLQNMMRRLAAIERIDHRLHNRNRAVVGPHIRPRLEIMRRGNVPVRLLARLVDMRAQMRDDLALLKASAKFRSAGAL